MKTIIKTFFVIFIAMFITSCGVKGDLKLPEEKPTKQQQNNGSL